MFEKEELDLIEGLGEQVFDEHFLSLYMPSPIRRAFLYVFADRYELSRKGAKLKYYIWHGRKYLRSYIPSPT